MSKYLQNQRFLEKWESLKGVIDRKPFIISVTVCFRKNGLQFIGMLTEMMEATEQADRQLESKGVM